MQELPLLSVDPGRQKRWLILDQYESEVGKYQDWPRLVGGREVLAQGSREGRSRDTSEKMVVCK